MNKLQLGTFAVLIAGQALAQRTFNPIPAVERSPITFSADRTPTDTLVPSGFLSSDLYTYYASEDAADGYVFGTNTYGDLAKAQRFEVTGTVNVEELMFFVGYRSGTGTVGFGLTSADGDGMDADNVAVSNAPGTVLAAAEIALDQVDTATVQLIALDPPLAISGMFYAGVDFSDLANTGGEIALSSTQENADGVDPNGSWELWSDETWHAVSGAWGVSWDMAVAVVIDAGSTNVGSIDRVNGVQMTLLGGNPATSNVQVMYDLEDAAKARLVVMDMKGARVVDTDLGRTMSGEHRMDLDVANWANGTYMVTIFADGLPMTKKLVVQH